MSTWKRKPYGSELSSEHISPQLVLATPRDFRWAQAQVTAHHYLHAPVDARSTPLAYVLKLFPHFPVRAGCLIFGRPEATRCYDGALTYGSPEDVQAGKARYSRWEVLNLARVWIHRDFQDGGPYYVRNLATWAIGQALQHVAFDYLAAHPPCFLDEPWRLRVCLSYCDTTTHAGTLYKAAGFTLARTNAEGKQTWARQLRGLQGRERKQIEKLADQSPRSRVYRSQRAAGALEQVRLDI